jgi:hypothetical protein
VSGFMLTNAKISVRVVWSLVERISKSKGARAVLMRDINSLQISGVVSVGSSGSGRR